MANRQRSFFDQRNRPRPHWGNNARRFLHGDKEIRTPPAPPPSLPPVEPSAVTKQRLGTFRFVANMPSYSERRGREHTVEEDISKENFSGSHAMFPPLQLPSSQRSNNKDPRECPQTPVGRLPLSELLSNGDDSRQKLNLTPIERVLWEYSPPSSQALLPSTQSRQRRKRAHSSSPASSAQGQPCKHRADGKTPANVQTLQETLKTPKADLVDDLWSRYSLLTRSPSAPDRIQLPHFMESSSPQTPAHLLQGRDSGGLRRALSCIDWPTSAAKRRKLRLSSSQRSTERGVDIERPLVSTEMPKLSRVSFLLEKIQDDLVKPAREPDVSSEYSSSPEIPRHASPEKIVVTSPPRQLGSELRKSRSPQYIAYGATRVDPRPPAEDDLVSERMIASSEFGEDDLDDDMVGALDMVESGDAPDARMNFVQVRTADSSSLIEGFRPQSANLMTGHSIPAKGRQASNDPRASVSKSHQDGSPRKDEFDDGDEEVSAADLEDVFARYDTQVFPRADKGCRIDGGRHAGDLEGAQAVAGSGVQLEGLSDGDEDFGGDSDFEQLAAEVEASQARSGQAQTQGSRDKQNSVLQRHIIKSIADSAYENAQGRSLPEKVLSVQNEVTKLSKVIILRGAWLDSLCVPGSYVHLIGAFDQYGQCIVDDVENLIILHPDHLISATVVGDSFECTRKAVLQDRVKATSDSNQSTTYGHMLHEIFQAAMKANRWDVEWMNTTIESIAARHLEDLFGLNIELVMAVEHLQARVIDLQAWAEIFIAAKPKPNALVSDRNGAQSLMCINKLLEVEEKVWSPMFGLKGNVDATVQIDIQDESSRRILTVPFELKTGKHTSVSHKAQTALYTLLLSDRYDLDIGCGILFYMQTSDISNIRTLRHELVPMILQRNALAGYIRHRSELPPMLKRAYTCGKCYAKTPCFIYHKLVDNGDEETSGMGDKFNDVVGHLNARHQEFFSKWDSLLTKEEKDIVRFRRELWTMGSSEREKAGRCFSEVTIENGSYHEDIEASKINRFNYTFVKRSPNPTFSFTESQLTLGEPIVISDEKGHFALANGYVTAVRKNKIRVTIDRRLHNARSQQHGFDADRNQVFTGIMKVVEGDSGAFTQTPIESEEPVVYRIDKDEFSNGMALVRNNLIKLMEKDVFAVQALRRLIVEDVAPIFASDVAGQRHWGAASQADLNVDQKAAIQQVMSAKDYALVLGMPGTGKTTTIAHIIRTLVAQGKNVLLTSYTHTAVDNILLKLRKDNIGIFRLGALAKVHPEVQEFADLAGRPIKEMEDLKRCYTQQVVATTCLGINHPIFSQRIFDYCIVDEASQITLPVCLGPIRMARAFILVGDHYQLPPLVQNQEALEGGLDISLFKMLSDRQPSSVVYLEHQYRMCEDIMSLSNSLIYKGRLKCGTEAVAKGFMPIPDISALAKHHHSPSTILSARTQDICISSAVGACWLRNLLDASVKACFVNTDNLASAAREVLEAGSRIINPAEAALTTQLVESFLTCGVDPADIGVITLYRSQLALIKQSLRHRPGVEMHTADKFQGRDKEVVVLSLVRSNESQIVGDLLKDWRRVNVALTRARTKLLILGSRDTLVGNDLLHDLIKLMERNGWVYDLPANAIEAHVFEEMGTQILSGAMLSDTAIGIAKGDGDGVGVKFRAQEKSSGKKVPAKQAKLDMPALMRMRPVLRDIVNDAR